MTDYLGYYNIPKKFRGAIVSVEKGMRTQAILFQYNPQQWSRSIEPRSINIESNSRTEVLRLQGAPVETITIDVEIDATDQLEKSEYIANYAGIYPQLSALEMLVYPKITQVVKNTLLLRAGGLEIIPDEGPLILLIWGYKRALPIRINSYSITEEAFDAQLNPIRARVGLSLRVLSYNDFSVNSPGYYVFMANQAVKEAMAFVHNVRW